jgi:hypothetical protein
MGSLQYHRKLSLDTKFGAMERLPRRAARHGAPISVIL